MNLESPLTRSSQNGVSIFKLNRPEQRNALSIDLIKAISNGLADLRSDQSIRAVVLTGEGTCFCSGMDLKEVYLDDGSEATTIYALREFADLLSDIHRYPKPVIAALNGDALAGGAGLALACDLVVASPSARIGYPEVRSGMVAAIVMRDLVAAVGDRKARELLLTGRPISAAEAERYALVNQLVPAGSDCLTAALDLASMFCKTGPLAIATTKQLLNEISRHPENLRGAAAVSAAVRESEEAQEGIRAFLERRAPGWTIES